MNDEKMELKKAELKQLSLDELMEEYKGLQLVMNELRERVLEIYGDIESLHIDNMKIKDVVKVRDVI